MQPLGPDEPRAIGPYRLVGSLGAGGMGRVYLGRSTGGRTVAVKIVHPYVAHDEAFRARFRREVAAARRVGGRWTAPVLDADPDAPVPWVATGFFAGPALSAAVDEHGPLPGSTVRALGAGLAQALAAVHALGLVHRDVKPSNVLLTLDGPRLIDFGIARAVDGSSGLTSTGVTVGSPGFMPPEAILGKDVTGAADVFSLGAVLAYAASGQTAFRGGSTATLLYKVVHEEPELGPMDAGLRELVLRCLEKEPGVRPGPDELLGLLTALDPDGPAAALPGPGWLPGPLVEEVSRMAVGLLDLEAGGGDGRDGGAEAAGPGAGGPPDGSHGSGLVPFTGAAAGEFGPPTPPPDAGPVSVPPGPEAVPSTPDPRMSYGRVPSPARPSVAVAASVNTTADTADAVPIGPPPAPDAAGRRRRRRISCSVTLTLALALGGLLLWTGFLRELLPGGGGGSGPDAAAKPSDRAAPSASASAAPPQQPSTVPAAFLGTWEGEITPQSADPGKATGTISTVIGSRGRIGQQIGTTTQKFPSGELVCVYHLTVQDISGDRLVADASGTEGERCWAGTQRFTFRLTSATGGPQLAFSGTGTSVTTEAVLRRTD
ncbi:serine/threonine-protein kinase [Streptomyces tsukubensis]|uniref:serine/threonine-protein kinase n=1 Tax=Streptomyces tsukubensis TaxID=83656 RepID=UPI0036ABAFB5